MQRTPVSSSQIASIGYNFDSRTLEIEFQSGGTFQYDNVPENIFAALIDAESVGKTFHSLVKGRYAARKV